MTAAAERDWRDLKVHADQEVISRAMSGTLAFFPILVITVLGTNLAWDHPGITAVFVLLLVMAGLIRIVGVRRARQLYPSAPGRAMNIFRAAILLTPLAWTGLCCTTFVLYGLGAQSALLVIVSAGISGGALASFNPDPLLHRAYQALVWLPPIVTVPLSSDNLRAGLALSTMMAIYLAYLLRQARLQAERYWQALNDNAMLATRTAQLEESQRIRDELLAVVTHDLGNALQVVMLASNAIARKVKDPTADVMVGRITESARYMVDLTRDLHDVARLGMKAIRLQPRPLVLDELAARIAEEQMEVAREHDVHLTFAPGAPNIQLNADPVRLRQVLTNLVTNAIKYNRPQGSVQLRTSCADGVATIDVQDSGIGIGPEDRERIFDLFVRTDGAGMREGSGLGLSITRQLVALHGGTLTVESEKGVGSTFRVTLPMQGPTTD